MKPETLKLQGERVRSFPQDTGIGKDVLDRVTITQEMGPIIKNGISLCPAKEAVKANEEAAIKWEKNLWQIYI